MSHITTYVRTYLMCLQDARQLEFFACREAILKLWSSLDQRAVGSFEEAIRDGDTKHFVLSESNMDSLHQLKAKVQLHIPWHCVCPVMCRTLGVWI